MDYPVLPGLTYDGVLYQNLEMGTVEAVIPPGVHTTRPTPPPPGRAQPGRGWCRVACHPGAAQWGPAVLLVRRHL